MTRRAFLTQAASLAAATSLPALSGAAFAQATSRIVVGFAAGGPGDVLARVVAEQLKRPLGNTVIVDNRPGAAGRIAINAVRSAEPDGLTMLNSPSSVLTLLPHAVPAGDFNPLQDLVPVGTLSELDFALVINGKLPARNLAEYLQLVRTNERQGSYGSPGAGTPQHMVGLMMGKAADVRMTHVAYKGGGPALQDVMGGAIPACIGTISEPMIAAHKDGRIRILATTGTKRSSFLTDVPTLAEAGLRGVSATDWTSLLVPARTPAPVIARLSRALLEVAGSAEFKTAINRFYLEPLALDAKASLERMQAEYAAWRPVVKASGFTLDT